MAYHPEAPIVIAAIATLRSHTTLTRSPERRELRAFGFLRLTVCPATLPKNRCVRAMSAMQRARTTAVAPCGAGLLAFDAYMQVRHGMALGFMHFDRSRAPHMIVHCQGLEQQVLLGGIIVFYVQQRT